MDEMDEEDDDGEDLGVGMGLSILPRKSSRGQLLGIMGKGGSGKQTVPQDQGRDSQMENDEVIDYTTNAPQLISNKHKGLREGGSNNKGGVPSNDNLQQQHLAFLRNYNWAMAQQQQNQHRGKVWNKKHFLFLTSISHNSHHEYAI